MAQTSIILGPIVLRDFEVPEHMNFGGAQRLAVHFLPGGARVIDALGRDDAEITFSGTFSGPEASARARAVDALRATGLPQLLSWDVFAYTVVIRDFHADYRAGNWIPFRIACTVLRDEAAAFVEAPLALAESLLGDVGIAAAAGIGMAGVLQALVAPGATTRASTAHATASARLAGARGDIAAAIAAQEAALPLDEITDAATLDAAGTAMRRLAELNLARAHAGRAAVNLANSGT
jgi:hypothetical protein